MIPDTLHVKTNICSKQNLKKGGYTDLTTEIPCANKQSFKQYELSQNNVSKVQKIYLKWEEVNETESLYTQCILVELLLLSWYS